MADNNAEPLPRANGLYTALLPPELIIEILGYLPIRDLRLASHVSRSFYSCAWDAGLYFSRTISLGYSSADLKLQALQELLQRAVPHNRALHLTISVYNNTIWPIPQHLIELQQRALVSAVTNAMPVLVELSLHLGENNYDLTKPLSHAMPRLRELKITSNQRHGDERLPLDQATFSGHAPFLRTLVLENIMLGATPSPAFVNVTSLRAEGVTTSSDISCAQHFPQLAHLDIRAIFRAAGERSDNLHHKLAGVTVRTLTIDEFIPVDVLQRDISLDEIPLVKLAFVFGAPNWIEPEADGSDFALRLFCMPFEGSDSALVTVVPSHRRWKRIYYISCWLDDTTLPLATKSTVPQHMTYLRVDNSMLHGVLSNNIALPALRRLQLDFRFGTWGTDCQLVWPPDQPWDPDANLHFQTEHTSQPTFCHESLYSVPCAALEQLSLCATHQTRGSLVRPREVAYLGRALGQLVRPRREKALLVLVGVEFALPEAHELLDATFSAVELRPLAMDNGDVGLWDDDQWDDAPL